MMRFIHHIGMDSKKSIFLSFVLVHHLKSIIYKRKKCIYSLLDQSLTKRSICSENNNPYNILGVSKEASADDIKKKFRELAKKYHPDLNPSAEAKNKMARIVSAYEILSDPIKRKRFDSKGNQDTFKNINKNYRDINADNMFTNISWTFPDIQMIVNKSIWLNDFVEFEYLFSKNKKNKGGDIFTQISIDFFEAINGTDSVIPITSRCKCNYCNGVGFNKTFSLKKCPNCNGNGTKVIKNGLFFFQSLCTNCNGNGYLTSEPCKHCSGNGFKLKNKNISVKIPKGTRNGKRIKLSGQGHYGYLGSGDLYIKVFVKSHSNFKWLNDDIHVDIPISAEKLFEGGEIKIPSLDNNFINVRIPPKTNPKYPYILEGKGPFIPERKVFGNYVIHFILKPFNSNFKGQTITNDQILEDENKKSDSINNKYNEEPKLKKYNKKFLSRLIEKIFT